MDVADTGIDVGSGSLAGSDVLRDLAGGFDSPTGSEDADVHPVRSTAAQNNREMNIFIIIFLLFITISYVTKHNTILFKYPTYKCSDNQLLFIYKNRPLAI